MPDEQEDILAAVRSEFHPHGRPVQVYLERNADTKLSSGSAAAITTAILLNQEDRICQLEGKRPGEEWFNPQAIEEFVATCGHKVIKGNHYLVNGQGTFCSPACEERGMEALG